MTEYILLFPPVALVVSFLVILGFSKLTSGLQPKPKNEEGCGKLDPYACGEDFKDTKIEPDYHRYFPFAIFFTVMHVAGLTIASIASSTLTHAMAGVAVIYTAGVFVVLAMLYGD